MRSELDRLRWHTTWTSVWAIVATFGCVAAAAWAPQSGRPVIVWDHQRAGFAEAITVIEHSQNQGHRMSALFVLQRELLHAVEILRTRRSGIDPQLAAIIVRDLHGETADR